ncbi:MAG: LPP20 family lipoprotein [Gammaproteobacteria bacterium]|nr:LPP20 family lipoprotein [Gammaproteobacteria bacterium]
MQQNQIFVNAQKRNRGQSFFILLLLICTYSSVTNATELPEWLATPPADSQLWFYSIGNGEDLKQAKNSALAELSTRIQIDVQTTTQQFVQANNQQVDYFLEQDNRFNSEKMSFNNVEVVREFKHEQGTYVLIKVDRDSFFSAKYIAIEENFAKLLSPENLQTPDSLATKLSKVINYQWQKNWLTTQLNILNAYDIDITELNRLKQKIEQDVIEVAQQVSTTLTLPENMAPPIRSPLEQWVTNVGFIKKANPNSIDLQIIATSANTWQGEDRFNHVHKIEFELLFLLNQQLLSQKRFSAQAFANQAQIAQQHSIEQLIQQLPSR